jgi:hypothetical protein
MTYIETFRQVIDAIEHDNTYKLAFARAVLECISEEEYEIQLESVVLYQYNIVQKIMKYYWNQIAFFNLSQGPSSLLENRIEEIKEEFYSNTSFKYPVWYDKVESFLKRNPIRFERQVKKFITLFTKSVAAKFRVSRRDKLELFELDTKFKRLLITEEQLTLLQEHESLLNQLIDYKWAMLLEEYNKAPNIIQKVIGSKEPKIRRQNLIKYRNLLLEHYHLEGAKDFFTGELVDIKDISMEHLIPFNFVFRCDIWNLIIVSKDTAKERRGKIPSEEEVKRLQERNQQLFDKIKDSKMQARFDLEDALNQHLVKRYYIDLIG